MIGFGFMVVPMSWAFGYLTVWRNDSRRKKDVVAIGPFRLVIWYNLDKW